MARLRSARAPPSATKPPPSATKDAPATTTRRPALREKTNTTGTPGPAVETSMLALKNFKRRPRQGSMLEMVKRRRSSIAQQSMLSARPQVEDDGVESTSVFDLGSASEDEEDFAPEAEGTPVLVSKGRRNVGSAAKSVASAAKSVVSKAAESPVPVQATRRRSKRKSDEMEAPGSALGALRKKRKSDDVDVSHSALDALKKRHRKSAVPPAEEESLPQVDAEGEVEEHASSDREESPVPNPITSDVQVVNSSPQSTPPTEPSSAEKPAGAEQADLAVPSTEEQERRKTVHDEEQESDFDAPNATMAEPASSSPLASPIPETQRTDIYADPLTQVSPPPREPAKTRSRGSKKQVNMSTATLRALLPRRTRRTQPSYGRTEYDIPSDEDDDGIAFDTTHLDEDEDELGGRTRRQTRAPAQTKGRKKTAAPAKTKPKQTRKSAAPAPSTKNKGKATRTYGRAAASDKENAGEESGLEEEEGDTSLTMHEVAHSKELEEARRKFAEVDEWDLSFESMSNEDHRSSSQGWR
ncbi:hypothetical protein WHR41_05459 [Cladosporium halotolerans]|uniref:Uncharacterized protein n=1 Tax=Cladosporium halotolerans TaxID=1052096 RepID=A0AB34KQ34_9PEZI